MHVCHISIHFHSLIIFFIIFQGAFDGRLIHLSRHLFRYLLMFDCGSLSPPYIWHHFSSTGAVEYISCTTD